MAEPKENTVLTVSSPEDGLKIHPDLDPMDEDMLDGILGRSKGLLSLLSAYFETTEELRGFKVSDQTMSYILWQLNGNLGLIEKLVSHHIEGKS